MFGINFPDTRIQYQINNVKLTVIKEKDILKFYEYVRVYLGASRGTESSLRAPNSVPAQSLGSGDHTYSSGDPRTVPSVEPIVSLGSPSVARSDPETPMDRMAC